MAKGLNSFGAHRYGYRVSGTDAGAELGPTSCCHETFFQRSEPCQYVGRCGRKDLWAMIEEGAEVDVDRLLYEKTERSGIMLGRSTELSSSLFYSAECPLNAWQRVGVLICLPKTM